MYSGPVGGSDDVPAGLIYVSQDAPDEQAVFIPVEDDERLVAVVEPGHDPRVMWNQLRAFLEQEGILGAAPFDPPSERDSPKRHPGSRMDDR